MLLTHRIKNLSLLLSAVIIIWHLYSCKNKTNGNIIYFKSGNIKELQVQNNDGKTTTYVFYENGILKVY